MEEKDKCDMSIEERCRLDWESVKCNGIDIPDECTYHKRDTYKEEKKQ